MARKNVHSAIAIDEEGTRVRDDAFWHLHNVPVKQRFFRIYLADVFPHIPIGSDREIAIQGRVGRMFSRSELQDWSLSTQQYRDAIELQFITDVSMKSVQDISMRRVRVRLQSAISFQEVGSLLSRGDDPMLTELLIAAKERGRQTRSGNFGFRRRNLNCIGHRIVSELGLFVNTELTRVCLRENVPIIFRNRFREDQLPLSVRRLRKKLDVKAEQMGRQPIPWGRTICSHLPVQHADLRLRGYAYFTSPLRKWVAQVNLRQLIAHLEGKALPYTRDDMRLFAAKVNYNYWHREIERSPEVLKTASEG